MKRNNNTFWNILALIALLAIIALIVWVGVVFNNPYSAMNPFPPPRLPELIQIPTSTNTPYVLPALWTPTVKSDFPTAAVRVTNQETESPTQVRIYTATPIPSLTPFVIKTSTSVVQPTSVFSPTPGFTATKGPTKTPQPTPTKTPLPSISKVTEKSGVKNDTWQKINGNPVFQFDVTKNMVAYAYYFGVDPKGGERELDKEGINYYWVEIHHDAKQVNLNLSMPADCGAFYLRIKIRYAIPPQPGKPITYAESGWKTVFTYKYDPTSPIPPWYGNIGIPNVIRGIQNVSADPTFDFSWVDGIYNSNQISLNLVAGDGNPVVENFYLGKDDKGQDKWKIVTKWIKCSGIKGYYVYWGQDINGVESGKFYPSSIFDPKPVPPNTPYFLRVKAMDNLGNTSDWRLVALDETYDYTKGYLPSPEQAVFYYDTIAPNNLTDLTVDNGVISNKTWTNDPLPSFSFSGGNDPVGFRTDMIYGYQVVWNTDPTSKPTFYPFDELGNTFVPNISKSGTYYLKIRALDWAGNPSKEWLTFIYKFDDVGPVGVTTVTENTGIPNNKFQKTGNDASFSWTIGNSDPGDSKTSSGPVPGYWVYWGTDPNADGSLFTFQTEQLYDPPEVTTGVYYLRIATFDKAGNFTITTPFTLKFDNTPPTPPTSAVEETGNKKNLRFTWNGGSDEGSGIKGYYVYVGTDPAGRSTENFTTEATFSTSLPDKGTYYLRVRVRDNADNFSDWVTLYTHVYN